MDDQEFIDAARAGARRAGYHLMRAGWEVLAGVGALVEELRKVMDGGDGDDEADGPEHIPVE